MFTYKFEYTVIEFDTLDFSDKEMKEIAEEYKKFITNTDDNIDVFRDFLSEYLYDFLPCYIYNVINDNIGEFYKTITNLS